MQMTGTKATKDEIEIMLADHQREVRAETEIAEKREQNSRSQPAEMETRSTLSTDHLTAEEQLLHEAVMRECDDKEWRLFPKVNGLGGVVTSLDEAIANRLDFSRAVISRWRQFKQTDVDQQSFDRR